MFHHSLNIMSGFNGISLPYVFKLIGFSPKGMPKMCQFF